MEEEQDDLELTNEQLVKICEYAERSSAGDHPADPKVLAFALQTVALCLHRLQAGDPPASGPGVDEWYDKAIGHGVRMMWMKVKPAAETLKKLGVID